MGIDEEFLSKAVEEMNKELCEKNGVSWPFSSEDSKEEIVPEITLEFRLD